MRVAPTSVSRSDPTRQWTTITVEARHTRADTVLVAMPGFTHFGWLLEGSPPVLDASFQHVVFGARQVHRRVYDVHVSDLPAGDHVIRGIFGGRQTSPVSLRVTP